MPITSDADDYAHQVVAALQRKVCARALIFAMRKINHKVREHSVAKVPVILACGLDEAVAAKRKRAQCQYARRRGSKEQSVAIARNSYGRVRHRVAGCVDR